MSLHLGLQHYVVKGDDLQDGSRVKSVRAFVVEGKGKEEEAGGAGDCHSQVGTHWIVVHFYFKKAPQSFAFVNPVLVQQTFSGITT